MKETMERKTDAMTPLKVRDSIIDCFTGAHQELIKSTLDMDECEKEKFSRASVIAMVKDQFNKTGGDYNNPTKESLFFLIIGLAELSKNLGLPVIF